MAGEKDAPTASLTIHRRLSQPDGIDRVRQLLSEDPDQSRSELADRLCDQFEFLDPRGQRQRSGCLKSLRVLESRGWFVLPAPRRDPVAVQPRRLDRAKTIPIEEKNTYAWILSMRDCEDVAAEMPHTRAAPGAYDQHSWTPRHQAERVPELRLFEEAR